MKNKFSARKTPCLQGHTHDSKAEAERCDILHIMQKHGMISELRIQVKYDLIPAMKYENMPNERGMTYIADFVYIENGVTVIEDVKSEETRRNPDYIIKRKLTKLKYCTDGKTVFREYINKSKSRKVGRNNAKKRKTS